MLDQLPACLSVAAPQGVGKVRVGTAVRRHDTGDMFHHRFVVTPRVGYFQHARDQCVLFRGG